MGSIADLLGDQLPDDWKETLSAKKETAPEEDESGTSTSPQDQAVVTAVLDETGFDPERMHSDLLLDEDLELFGLPLWSVVADIERELEITIPDDSVRKWQTLGDILDAANGH